MRSAAKSNTSTMIASISSATASTAAVQNPGVAEWNISKGLLSLAMELLDIILLEFGTIGEADVNAYPAWLPSECGERGRALRALSQTCKAYRAAFLPLAWAHVDACLLITRRASHLQLAERLERLSKGLADNPHLAAYVKVFSFTLTKTSLNSVLPAFIDCLKKLPNLHTLQLLHASKMMTTTLKSYFAELSLPQIQAVVIPDCAHNILRTCPNVRFVTCNEGDGRMLVRAIATTCKYVEVLKGIRPDKVNMQRIVKKVRNLEVLGINTLRLNAGFHNVNDFPRETLAQLSLASRLRTIIIMGETDDNAKSAQTAKYEQAACAALKNSKAKGTKSVVVKSCVVYRDHTNWVPYVNPWFVVETKTIDAS